ncbi:tail fiber domain-containing protein [Aeromonas sp.]|uniref:tail fiber domain-containing protein n=1 Tax=Aeromonas sp. TaxID=647 RepID=UPI0025856006|nr:tail fiber domain-containing protein [Aeromonas sp.]MCX7128036.1 tail fiber domain-containing protein [Aeromonas sp.]
MQNQNLTADMVISTPELEFEVELDLINIQADFKDLRDTQDYKGHSLELLRVNATETGIEYLKFNHQKVIDDCTKTNADSIKRDNDLSTRINTTNTQVQNNKTLSDKADQDQLKLINDNKAAVDQTEAELLKLINDNKALSDKADKDQLALINKNEADSEAKDTLAMKTISDNKALSEKADKELSTQLATLDKKLTDTGADIYTELTALKTADTAINAKVDSTNSRVSTIETTFATKAQLASEIAKIDILKVHQVDTLAKLPAATASLNDIGFCRDTKRWYLSDGKAWWDLSLTVDESTLLLNKAKQDLTLDYTTKINALPSAAESLKQDGYTGTPTDLTSSLNTIKGLNLSNWLSVKGDQLEGYLLFNQTNFTDNKQLVNKYYVDTRAAAIETKVAAIPAGPQGVQGLKGDKGDKGDQGIQGVKGVDGKNGANGATGATGAQGQQGLKGDQGIQGATGPKGDKGDDGIQGLKGANGATGAVGPRGPDGAVGSRGEKGEQGIQGLKGDKGDNGDQGIQGPIGATGPMNTSCLPLVGGTITGPVNIKYKALPLGQYVLNLNDGDIGGINQLVFNDVSEAESEGILFPKKGKTSASANVADYDCILARDGQLLFNKLPVYHTGNKPTANDVGAMPISTTPLAVNLNTLGAIANAGVYYQPANAGATTANNYPEASAGSLVVSPSAYGCQQEYTTFNTHRKYIRSLTSAFNGSTGPWNAWQEFYGPGHIPSAADVGLGQVPNMMHTPSVMANTVAVRDTNADVSCRLLKSTYANDGTMSGAIAFRINNTTDNYTRYCSDPAAVRSWLGVVPPAGASNLIINNGAPTITLQDTDGLGAVLHNNSNLFYILRTPTANNPTFDGGPNGRHPMTLNLSNGDVVFSGNVVAYSDARLKHQVKPLQNALSKVLALRPVNYQRIGEDTTNRVECGFIAQELKQQIPEVVFEQPDEDKTLAVDYSKLVAYLAGAVQELQQQINELKLGRAA